MSKVQLRLYIETDDDDYTKERSVLMYVQDMFKQEFKGFEEDVKEAGNSILAYDSRIEHGW